MLNNRSRIDLAEKCLGEIGRSLLVLSHEVGHGECSVSSYQIVADIETKIDEVSNHIKSPGMPADYVLYVKRVLSPIKKELAQLNDYNTSLEELAPKLEPDGVTLYGNCFEHDPPTSFPGISRELQKLKDLIEVYDPNSALAMPMAKWIGFGVLLLAQNHNDILSAQEHSEIQNRAYAIVTFLNTIKSRSKKKSLRYIDETIRFLKVQEEYANVNRPTSQSLDALEEFNLFVDELCGCIVNSLYRSDDWPWSYSLDEIMSLSKGVGETLYSGQSLFSDKDKHEVEQAFRKSVEILVDATKSEFWDDFADLTKAWDVLMEYYETLLDAELSLCKLSPGRVALADRGGPGNAAKVNDLPVDAGGKVGHGGSGGQGGGAILANSSAMTGEARALSVLVIHPEWTNKKIAEAAGVHEKSLNRYKKFKAAQAAVKEVGKAALLKGHKTSDGDLEAYDEIN
jgi:hypothetical protein